jgi:hypothetical protein
MAVAARTLDGRADLRGSMKTTPVADGVSMIEGANWFRRRPDGSHACVDRRARARE